MNKFSKAGNLDVELNSNFNLNQPELRKSRTADLDAEPLLSRTQSILNQQVRFS